MKAKKSLAETHPEIADQWHPKKNGVINPNDVFAGSNKKFWWKCDRGEDHEWEASQAIKLNPNNPNAYFSRGIAKAALGNQYEACRDVKRALKLGFDNSGKFYLVTECGLE